MNDYGALLELHWQENTKILRGKDLPIPWLELVSVQYRVYPLSTDNSVTVVLLGLYDC
jgi:hypothetical protein